MQSSLPNVFRNALLAAAILAASPSARAVDGNIAEPDPTYYETTTSSSFTGTGLPSTLHIVDSTATAAYALGASTRETLEWTLDVRGFLRRHERVDAVYQIVVVLPLPSDSAGGDAFDLLAWGLTPQEGTPGSSVPLVYGGEKVILKRNVTLEETLLPNLIDPSGSEGKLPDLSGTGYKYTLWDAIVRYDAGHGDTVQAFATLRYTTDAAAAPPDAGDDRLQAYVIVWIPTLDPSVAPFTIRMDVVEPE